MEEIGMAAMAVLCMVAAWMLCVILSIWTGLPVWASAVMLFVGFLVFSYGVTLIAWKRER